MTVERERIRRKYAVIDGPWWDGKGEVSLYWGDADGNNIADIPWPPGWPQYVDEEFLRKRGFIVETA